MFYNLFLPGAISGDAYKVILLHRKYKLSLKKGTAAVLLDRFSGVLALGLILCAYAVVVLDKYALNVLIVTGAILSIAGFYALIRFWFKEFLPGFWNTLFWGLGVQLSQVVAIYFIVASLQLPVQHEWIFIFLLSAVITVLPISLGGGLGTRELVFAEGARFFQLEPQTAVVISLLFYLVTVLGSLWGLYYQFHDPIREVKNEK